MKKYLLYTVLIISCASSCKKDGKTTPTVHFDEIFQINFTIDNIPATKVYPKDSLNILQGYHSDLGNGNYYFGGGGFYKLDIKRSIGFQLGSAYGALITDPTGSFKAFSTLCSPGSKIYDNMALGSQTQTNRVEFSYYDENGNEWSTTKMDLSDPAHPKPAAGPIQPTGSTFIITDKKDISLDNTTPDGVIIKGTFNCILYKWGSNDQKTVRDGTFIAAVAE